MAINPYNFLREILGELPITEGSTNLMPIPAPDVVAHALNYSMVGDRFEPDQWKALQDACKDGPKVLAEVARNLLPKFEAEWIRLGKPRTSEEWVARQNCEHCGFATTAAT